MTTKTVRTYLDLSDAITALVDARVGLDVPSAETRVVVSGRTSVEAMRADAPGQAVRNTLHALNVARRDARMARPERRDHYASKANEAFENFIAALVAAGVPAK